MTKKSVQRPRFNIEDECIKFTLRLPSQLNNQVNILAADRRISKNSYIEDAVVALVKKHWKQPSYKKVTN